MQRTGLLKEQIWVVVLICIGISCAALLQDVNEAQVQQLVEDLRAVYDRDSCVFLCGNGGSGSSASHLAQDLGKSTLTDTALADDAVRRLRIISLTDNTPYILAWANDFGYERIFVEQLKNLARPGDVLVSLSGSGDSPNVLRAVEWANSSGLITWGVTGFDGGKLRHLAQRSLHLPHRDMGQVECVHLLIFHWVLEQLQLHISGMDERLESDAFSETSSMSHE